MFIRSRELFVIAVIFSFLTTSGFGQPKEWGEVSDRILEMNAFPQDSSASAVVLFDKADIDFNRKLEYVMERHVRVKIINEDGYKWATTEVSFNDKLDQDVYDIEGHTLKLSGNGQVEEHELKDESIFEEDITGDFKRVKFTLPSLAPGAVIEFRYKKHIGDPALLPDWEFQRTIPVAWSEYKVKVPDWFYYKKMVSGHQPVYINKQEPFHDNIRFTIKTRTGSKISRTRFRNMRLDIDGSINRWVMKDLPALEEMPYMTTVNDYKSKLWLQLTLIQIPNQMPRQFLRTWESVAEELSKADKFGKRLDSNKGTRHTAKRLTVGLEEPVQRLLAIYDFMVETMVWDETNTVLAENDLEDVLEARKGSSAELNLLLIQLLREAGLTADPVVMSTRTHGKINEYFAIANQFNHVICRVKLGEKEYLLDATSKDKIPGILPADDLNRRGLLIGKNSLQWIELKPQSKSTSKIVLYGKLTNEGKISGKVSMILSGNDASENYLLLKERGDEDFVKQVLFKGLSEAAIDSFRIGDRNPITGSFRTVIYFTGLDFKESQSTSQFIYFNPMLFLRNEENPFTQPDRDIPVDYPFLFQKEFIANLVVPSGFEVEEVPKSIRLSIPGRGIELSRLAQVAGNRITILSRLNLKRKTFETKLYKYLRDFYSQTIALQSQQVVLKEANSGK